jgi:EAL domain-containing protein (putative c-di-GMP-specific phosphodiesterase class I)
MLDLCAPRTDASTRSREWSLSGRIVNGGSPQTIELTPLPFRIGRRAGLSLSLSQTTVSSAHAEIFERDGRLMIRDLGSTNGTFVNGDRLFDEHPLHENDLIQFADLPFRLVRNQFRDDRSHTRAKDACDQALAIVQFDQLVLGRAVVPHYQPIVDLRTNRLEAFEVLARSRLVGLETPNFMFTAAAQLGLTHELTQMLRRIGIEECGLLPDRPLLFLNSHPCELETQSLLTSCEELRRRWPQQRITIEIHEAAIASVTELAELRRGLEAIDMTLAFDDFGAGQARIVELAEVLPKYIKFDRSMIQNLDSADGSRRRFVASLVAMVLELGVIPLAEGIETAAERDACLNAGFVLAQGFFHGKPRPAAHYLRNELGGS